ncbi:uncharacterized protein [Palaemon carinicauda]|uniref:uncharacterized protein n=1 Tax=Palaemon carinicauda TaxID=392227 RepID=UPI0035B61B33
MPLRLSIYQYDQSPSLISTKARAKESQVIEPPDPPKEPGPPATEEAGSVVVEGGEPFSVKQQKEELDKAEASLQPTSFERPTTSILAQDVPNVVTGFTPFYILPTVKVLSDQGNEIMSLGHSSNPWQVTANLTSGPSNGGLLGTKTVPYVNGSAVFSDLAVSQAGNGYEISFSVTYPETAPPLVIKSKVFRALEKEVTLKIMEVAKTVTPHENFHITLGVVEDSFFKNAIRTDYLMGQEMTVNIQLDPSGEAQGSLHGNTSIVVKDGNIANFTLRDLSISEFGSYKYRVMGSVMPARWNVVAQGSVDVLPSTTNSIFIRMRAMRRSGRLRGREKEFGELLLQELKGKVTNTVYWHDVSVQLIRMVPYAQVQVSGSKNQLQSAILTLCEATRFYKVKVFLKCRYFFMTDLRILKNGRVLSCPKGHQRIALLKQHRIQRVH